MISLRIRALVVTPTLALMLLCGSLSHAQAAPPQADAGAPVSDEAEPAAGGSPSSSKLAPEAPEAPEAPGGAPAAVLPESADRVETITDAAGPGPASPPGNDTVESISSGVDSFATPAAVNAPVERFELHGWARQSFELGFAHDALHAAEPDATVVPYDRIVARTQLLMRARYSRGRRFEANVSGTLNYGLFEQGPDRAAATFTGLNGATRGVLEPRLQELYVGFFWTDFDLRIGQQRVAWLRADFISPNDVLNARDLRDPFVSETELRSIPTLMVRADIDLGFGSLEAIVSPLFVPDVLDVYGSNWAGVQPDAPIWARGLAGIARHSLDPTQQDASQRLLQATRYPKSQLSEPIPAVKFSWTAGGVDVSHYYQYGFDGPLIALDPQAAAGLGALDFSRAGLSDLGPFFAAIDAGQKPFQATFVRRHHVGLDAATTLGPFAFRLDAAYQSKRVFFRRDLLGATSPTFQGVLAIEYQTGDKDKLVLVEGNYLHLFDAPAAPLLVYQRDNVGVAGNFRWPLWDRVGVELRVLAGFAPVTEIVQPQINVKLESLVLSLGALWLEGDDYSFGHYFRRNQELYVKVKYAF